MWKKRILAFLLCLCMVIPSELATVNAEETTSSEATDITSGENQENVEEAGIPECVCNTTETQIYNHADDCVLKTYCKNLVDNAESVDALYVEYQKLPENGQQCVLDYLNAVNYYGHAKEGWYTQLQELIQKNSEDDVCCVCGNKGCETQHVWCEVCEDYDCGKNHVWCDTCNKYDCGIVHGAEIPTIYDTIVDSEGNVQTVTVSAEEFPDGAKLTVERADVTEQLSDFGINTSKMVFGLDISVLNTDGIQWQPNENGVLVKIPVSSVYGEGTKIGILHTHAGNTEYLGYTEVLSDGTIEIYTDGFSEFAGFTVDFHYNGVDFSIDGMTSILLSDLFAEMGIAEDATQAVSVTFSDETLVQVTQEENDWRLTSLQAFSTNELLSITFVDGHGIVIDVTDATDENTYWNPADGTEFTIPFDLTGNGNVEVHIQKRKLSITYKLKIDDNWGKKWTIEKGNDYVSVSSTNSKNIDVTINKNAPIGTAILVDRNSGACGFYVYVYEYVSINFNNGGKSASSMPDNTGAELRSETNNYTLPSNTPTANGYTFKNWQYTNYQGNSATVSPGGAASLITDTTFTAQWTTNTYTATFEANGGSVSPTSTNFNIEETLSLPTPTAPAGYTFGGWKVTSAAGNWTNGITYAAATTAIAAGMYGNVTFTAQWNPIEYTISYSGLDGATITANSTSYNVETTSFTLNNPTKTGYIFAGWKGTGLSSASTSVTIAKGSTGNRSYTATWTPISYYIAFNGNGSTDGNMSSQSFVYGTAQNLTANAFSRCYAITYNSNGGTCATSNATATATFNGWATSATGNKVYNDKQSVSNLTTTAGGTVNLYANWTLGSVTLPTPTKTGYTFGGWYTDSALISKAGDAGASYTPTANTTLYAKWTVNDYTIDYNLDGGTVNPANPTSYNVETDTFTLNNPTRANYSFAGWTGTGLYVATKTVTIEKGSTGNRAYIATWELNAYTVTAEIASGQGTISLPTQTIEYGENGQMITFTPATGYVISAITVDGQGVTVEDSSKYTHTPTNVQKSYDVIVTMLPVEYSITYKDDGNVISTVNYTIEDNITLASAPARAGYTFKGWKPESTVGSWTESIYSAGQNVGTGQYGDVTLVTQWTQTEHTATAVAGTGISATTGSGTYYYDTSVTFSATVKDGYTFDGWYNGDSKLSSDISYTFTMPDASVSYTAKATVNTYTITWNLKYPDDTVKTYIAQENVEFSSAITPPEVDITNYIFSNDWQVTSPAAGDVPTTMPNNDLVIQGTLTFNGGSLTITKNGMEAGKSTVYTISGSKLTKPVSVAIEGSGSVTVNYLPAGTYTVKEEAWSWEYACESETPADGTVDGIVTIEISKGSTANVTFSNQKKTSLINWLGGEFRKNNKFGYKLNSGTN